MAQDGPIHFLKALPKDEAERVWHQRLELAPLGEERVTLAEACGRVLARDVDAPLDVPPFDRALVDGFALVASDTFPAEEVSPARLRLLAEAVPAGHVPSLEVGPGTCVQIATGGVIPRGANAVQMVEHSETEGGQVLLYKPVAPGANIQSAGADMRAGETVLRQGILLSSRETGVLAALGLEQVTVQRRPRVAVISTGDELIPPGQPLQPGAVYDSNARILSDAVLENGGEPDYLGIVPDVEKRLLEALERARTHDMVLLSGGTSKGAGDLTFRLINRIAEPGVLVHGVSVKPGKPIVLAAWEGRPVVVLPGFPTSSIITFNLFVRPVLRRLAGLGASEPAQVLEARLAQQLKSAQGRHEYALVDLVPRQDDVPAAYPIPQASGSMGAFARADGYVEVPADRDFALEGESVRVHLLSRSIRPPDLVFVGSHCRGVDVAVTHLRARGIQRVKVINVGSTAGITAARRGEADFAGVHLLDETSGEYNREALRQAGGEVALVRGYIRRQGVIYRKQDYPGDQPGVPQLVDREGYRLINRNRGAGTRVLLDLLLEELARERGSALETLSAGLEGYEVEARSHNAVAVAIAAGRADWGLGIEAVAAAYGLGFTPLRDEEYDFLAPRSRLERPAAACFLEVLRSEEFRHSLGELAGFRPLPETGEILA